MTEPRILNTRTGTADPAALQLHPDNPRRGDVNAVADSFRENGFWGTVCVDERTGYVVVGNHRVLAARQLGWPEIPVTYIRTEDDTHALRVLLADNRTSDLGTYDAGGLALLLDHLASTDAGLAGTGYSTDAYGDLLASLPSGGLPPAERANDPAEEWGGMPEFEQPDASPYRTINVHFEDEGAVEDFMERMGQEFSEAARYIWHPERERVGVHQERYVSDAA